MLSSASLVFATGTLIEALRRWKRRKNSPVYRLPIPLHNFPHMDHDASHDSFQQEEYQTLQFLAVLVTTMLYTLYTLARTYIAVECFVSLRCLSAGTFNTVN